MVTHGLFFEMSTIFTQVLSNSNTGNASTSFRQQVTITAASLGQVRCTFQAGQTSPGWSTANCSIGVAATAPNTAATPIELLFSGVSGFSIAANATITSDWANLSALITDTLVVVMDTSANGTIEIATGVTGANTFFKGGASFNASSVSGYSQIASDVFGVNLIETQAAAQAAASTVTMPNRLIMLKMEDQ